MLETEKGRSLEFHHSIDALAKSIAKKGNVVVEGKIAIRMLGDISDKKIWLKALGSIRAERYAKKDHTSIEAARKDLSKKENEERGVFEKVYGFDYFEQEKEADIVVDTSDKTPEEIVNIIIRGMETGHRE